MCTPTVTVFRMMKLVTEEEEKRRLALFCLCLSMRSSALIQQVLLLLLLFFVIDLIFAINVHGNPSVCFLVLFWLTVITGIGQCALHTC